MKSDQILSALNSESHRKHAKNKLDPVQEQPNLQEEMHANEFESVKLPQVLPDPPQFLMQILNMQQKSKFIAAPFTNLITKARKQREKNVYLAFIQSQLAYLNEVSKLHCDKNNYGFNLITDVLQKRFNLVSSDLQNGKIFINKERAISTKQQADLLNEIDRARLLKIKDGSIRSKLDLLNQRIDQMKKIQQDALKQEKAKQYQSVEQLNKKLAENLDRSNFTLNSEKTKIASDYVKHMTEQRKQYKKRQKLREQRLRKVQFERSQQIKQAQKIKDEAKKKQILARIQETKKKREKQEQQLAKKQEQIQKFLSNYKKEMPIFKRKQKQFAEKYVKPEQKYREEKLKQIKQKKKSYSLNDIVDHQKKYEDLRKKQQEKKSQEKSMYIKSLKINTKQHYRGSIHEIVEEVDRQARQKNVILYRLGKDRRDRIGDYGKRVKQQKKPKVDENKRKQLLRVLELQKMKKEKLIKKYKQVTDQDGEQIRLESFYQKIPEKNRYLQGNRLMQIAKMRRNKNISQSVQVQPQIQPQTNTKLLKSRESELLDRKNADRQIWQIRSNKLQKMANKISSRNQFQQIKISFQNMDDIAAKKQQVLKYARMNVDEHLEQKNALDQFYIQSIKNKMKLLDD